MPSARCCERIQRAGSLGRPPVSGCRGTRRSSRSSASIVTLVSSSPFHQPAGCWRPSRWSRARSTTCGAGRGAPGRRRCRARPGRSRSARRASAAARSSVVPSVMKCGEVGQSPVRDLVAGSAEPVECGPGAVDALPRASAARPSPGRRPPRRVRRRGAVRRRRRSPARSQVGQLAPAGRRGRVARTTGSVFLRDRRSAADRLAGHLPGRPRCRAGRRRAGRPARPGRRSGRARRPVGAGAPHEHRTRSRRSRRAARRSCPPAICRHSSSDTSARGLEREVGGLTARSARGWRRRAAARPARRRAAARASASWARPSSASPARIAVAHAPDRPDGRAVPALDVAVHQVVVEQREVVHQLDRHRARHAVDRASPPAARAPSSASAGRIRLAAGRSPGCRRHPSSRAGSRR